MCGIFACVGDYEDASAVVLEGLKRLEYRGYDSWGVAIQTKDKIKVEKKIGKIGTATLQLPKSVLSLGHTRWATHGGVTPQNAHPHFDCSEELALIHNGIVENFQELKDTLKTHRFRSDTDTEVIVHLLEDELKKDKNFPEAMRKTFSQLHGLNAVAAIYKEQIVVAKNGSPIVLGKNNHGNLLASDASALLPLTKTVYFLEDNQMAVLDSKTVAVFNLKSGGKVNFDWQELDWQVEEANLGEYQHYMIKEINEQPKVILNVAENLTDQIVDLSNLIKEAKGTFFIGSGTASFAAMVGTYLFSKVAHVHVNMQVASEFNYLEDFLNEKSLIIALSQSGETIDVIEPLQRARLRGSKIVALVNTLGSTIYRLADYRILLGAGPETAVASTKAYIAKVAVLLLLAFAIDGRIKEGRELLLGATGEVKRLLTKKSLDHLRKICRGLKDMEHIYVIGRGISYPIALEAALKIKEVSYIHTEALPGGELKHGTLALIDSGTPCIVFAPLDETYEATISNAMEIKARGGRIIGVSSRDNKVFDEFIEVKNFAEATIIPMVIPAQLFGYFLAIEKGLDPDKPRNLAKAVTVK